LAVVTRRLAALAVVLCVSPLLAGKAEAQAVEWRALANMKSGSSANCFPMLDVTIREEDRTWSVSITFNPEIATYTVPLQADGSADVEVVNPNSGRSGRYTISAGRGARPLSFLQLQNNCRYDVVPM
jgi:hypothetical protein